MSSNTKTYSYVDPEGNPRKFMQDDKNIIVTFNPQDQADAKEVIKTNSPKGFQAQYINEEVGFARIETTPGQTFSSTMSSFNASPSSEVINGVISAAVEDVKTGPGITRYFLPNRLFISLKEQYIDDAANIFGKYGMTIVKDYSLGYYSVNLQAGASDLESLFNAINANKGKPEFNYVDVHEVGFNTALTAPTDLHYVDKTQWGLLSATATNDIDAAAAWGLTTGDSKVRVAVLDTGVDTNHPDIVDVNGTWNQVAEQFNAITNATTLASVEDNQGHGTIVAGTVGAKTNNGAGGNGLAGVGWDCRLFVVKIDEDLVTLDYAVVVNGINQVKTRAQNNSGANGLRYVMNLSWTCTNSSSVHTAITQAFNAGVVIVAAAGDGNQNIGLNPTYPAAWTEVIPAAAHTNGAGPPKRGTSNWGNNVVIAPGDLYPTTAKGGGSTSAGGTSVAAAFVSGVAALCWSRCFALHGSFNHTRADVYNSILQHLTAWPGGSTPCKGRLNANSAVSAMP